MKTLLGFFLLLIQLALLWVTLPPFILTVVSKFRFSGLGSYRLVFVSSLLLLFTIAALTWCHTWLFCSSSSVLVPSWILILGRTILLYPKCSEMVTNCVLIPNLRNGSYPSWWTKQSWATAATLYGGGSDGYWGWKSKIMHAFIIFMSCLH